MCKRWWTLRSIPTRAVGTRKIIRWRGLDAGSDGVIIADLARQGFTSTDIPAVGQRVLIQRNGNVAIDCTDEVHPEVARVVELAVRTVALDIAWC